MKNSNCEESQKKKEKKNSNAINPMNPIDMVSERANKPTVKLDRVKCKYNE